MQERYCYTAYGKPTFLTGAFGSRASSSYAWDALYTGRQFDAETGFGYFRHRILLFDLGSFGGRDPIGYFGGDSNLYRYVESCATDATDPFGMAKRPPVLTCEPGRVNPTVCKPAPPRPVPPPQPVPPGRAGPHTSHIDTRFASRWPSKARSRYQVREAQNGLRHRPQKWDVYGDSPLAGLIIGSGCVTRAPNVPPGNEKIVCSGSCDEIKTWDAGGYPGLKIFWHEACHACAYEDYGKCFYLYTWAGDPSSYCSKNPVPATPLW